jgi:hypothetical protein
MMLDAAYLYLSLFLSMASLLLYYIISYTVAFGLTPMSRRLARLSPDTLALFLLLSVQII